MGNSTPRYVRHCSAEPLRKAYNGLTLAGAPNITKVQSTEYHHGKSPVKKEGLFTASHQAMWGSVASLTNQVLKAGLRFRTMGWSETSVWVTFDIPTHFMKEA